MLFALLVLHAALAVAAPLLSRRLGRAVFLACGAAPALTTVWAFAHARRIMAGDSVRETLAWAPSLGLTADLRLDAFALVMVALVSGIGTLVYLYAFGYFDKPRDDLGRFAGTLTAFAGSMLGLVLADNILLLFAFWELTSITSYLLIGFEDRKAAARDAALQALLVTGAGGLALLGGLVLIGEAAGTYSLSALLAAPPQGGAVNAGLVLVLLGAFTKSAQVPFHTWLPGAMAAPTPVSAYLHSATMVKAGVYLIARLAPAFAVAGLWRPLVVSVGVATMLVGAYRALRQHDLKLLLAFGTVSQLGFMVALFGVGTPEATFAGVALLLGHGLFKAALFMVVGIIDHEARTRDLRRLSGLYRVMPATFAVAAVATASMAGLPLMLGFISKEAAYEAFLHAPLGVLGAVALAGVVAGSVLTFAYGARFLYGGFASRPVRVGAAGAEPHPPPAMFLAPAALLAALTVVFGVVPAFVDQLVNQAASALNRAWEPETLRLWHGFNAALALSALTVAGGVGLFAARGGVEALQSRLPVVPGSLEAYQWGVHGLLAVAKRLTGVVQNGSLPVYLTVILLTALLLPAAPLLAGAGLPAVPTFAANSLQALLGVAVIAAALAAVLADRRFNAVLLLGAVGYGVGLLFVVHGAPDLALTQFLVETLVLFIFVLVLRHLPARFAPQPLRGYRLMRAAVAGLVGLFVFGFALVAGGVRSAPPVSAEYLARALPEAHGANVVNVILVDFRALDTLGEIIVLVVAAVGITSLVLAGRALRAGGGDAPVERAEPDAGAHPDTEVAGR